MIGKEFTAGLGLRIVVALASIVAVPALLAGPAATSANAGAFVSATNGSDAGNDCTDQYAPCATIQHAIDETVVNPFVSFPSITVAPGIYTEQLTVDKSLYLHGPNSRLDDRGPEAVIDGGGGTAITPEASNITISGFTISTGSAGTPIRTTGADVNRLTISANIIEGGASSGVWLGAGGSETKINRNRIEGDEHGIRLGAADYSELTIWYNRLTGPVDSNGVFAGPDTSIDDFRLEGNEFATSSLAAAITNGWILANKIEPPAGGVGLRANLTESYVRENSFRGKGAGGCLQLLGGQGGLGPSNHIMVDDNEFAGCAPYALQLGPEANAITITMNTFPNTYDGIVTDDSSPWDVTGRRITVYGNRFVGLTHLGVYNAVGGELDARDNWWGCNGGPGAVGCVNVSPGVDASPNVVLAAEAVEVGKYPWDAEPVHALNPGEKAWIRTYLKDGDGGEALNVSIITDDPVLFSSAKGTFSWPSNTWSNAQSGSVFTAGPESGPAEIVVAMDYEEIEVPLTICCESAVSVLPPSTQSPTSRPQIRIPGGALSLSRRNALIGTISCAQSACRIDRKSAEVRVGRMRFNVRLKMQADIAAESIGQIRAILPERAFRQLSRHGSGTLLVAIKVTDASGGTAMLTRRVKIVPGDL